MLPLSTKFAGGSPMDIAARAVMGDPAVRGVVLDTVVADVPPDPRGRYASVVKTPDDYGVIGFSDDPYAASAAVARFWDGMRALLAPVDEPWNGEWAPSAPDGF